MKGTKDGQGFDSDWNCQNTLIQYNYSHDNEGGFLLICNNGDFGGPGNVGNIGTVVRYNISQNDGARTFQISAVKNTEIYNNTIYIGEGLSVKAALFHSWGGWAEHTHFVNNIFVADGAMSYEFGNTSGTMFSNNVFVGNHVGRPADPEAILADPELTDPGTGRDGRNSLGGYTLRADAPAFEAGFLVTRREASPSPPPSPWLPNPTHTHRLRATCSLPADSVARSRSYARAIQGRDSSNGGQTSGETWLVQKRGSPMQELDNYEQQVYAGVLGKVNGVCMGRPFEDWTKDRIVDRGLAGFREFAIDPA
jgi:hypothetical protein